MWFGIFTLITALTISVIAAWYSIIGLTAIFAAAFVPIVLMGGSLEVGKVVTAVWLHQNWHRSHKLMKGYLTSAVIVLMLITSMGIFGFLSKAHIEQTAAGVENVAKIEQYKTEAERQLQIVERSTGKIDALENAGSVTDTKFQDQIDKEQSRIDSAYKRIQPAIAEQNSIIADQSKLLQKQIDTIDADLARLQSYIDANEIKKAQQLIGEKSKGGWGPKTSETARLWRLERTDAKAALFVKMEDTAQNNGAIVAARTEIARLRKNAEDQIAQSNTLIDRLRGKIGSTTAATNADVLIDEHHEKISKASAEIERLTTARYELEGEYRQLEAEVGPIKYIAEFVFGEEADQNMLERAVRWVMLMLIFVFDPLAICLILAGAQQIMWSMPPKKKIQIHDVPTVIPSPPVPLDDPSPIEGVVDSHVTDFVLEDPEPSPFEEKIPHPEEPEPSVETIEEPTQSIVDSMEQLEPKPKVETEQKRQGRLKEALRKNNTEREAIVRETQREDANPIPKLEPTQQPSEVKSTRVLTPNHVGSTDHVPGSGKPFVKKHK